MGWNDPKYDFPIGDLLGECFLRAEKIYDNNLPSGARDSMAPKEKSEIVLDIAYTMFDAQLEAAQIAGGCEGLPPTLNIKGFEFELKPKTED